MDDFRLKVFVSVAKHLSFTKAAQELFVSQPSITKHIRELETRYELELFERQGSSIKLTQHGEALLAHCERILEAYSNMTYHMNQLRNEYAGELRLGASTTIAQYVLPVLLAKFTKQHPNLKLSLHNDNSQGIERALQNRTIDLGLVEGQSKMPQLRYVPFVDDELVVVTHHSSCWAKLDEVDTNQLRSMPLVLRELGSGTLEVIKTALATKKLKLTDMQVRIFLGSTESIKHFLEHSDCVGIVSIRSIDRELLQRQFKVIEVTDMEMKRTFAFALRQGHDGGLAEMFMQFAEKNKTEV